MNILIVGFGSVGKHYFKILENKFKKKVKKIIIFDPFLKQKFSEKKIFHIKQKKNLKKILHQINYAIISNPTNLHFEFAKLFLDNKIDTIIEKPFVLKISDAQELIKISRKNRVRCWVAFQNRYNLAVRKLKEEIEKKKIGKINIIDCAQYWHRDKKYYNTNWRGNYKTDGGVLANQAIHLLDILIYFFGEIKKFNVMADFNKKKLKAEDLIFINFQHKNNIFSNFKATTRANKDYRSAMDIFGENGRILVKGISLNTFNHYKKGNFVLDKKNSEIFDLNKGPLSGMGNSHARILKEFLENKQSTQDLEISKNLYLIYLIHSIYNEVTSKKQKFNLIKKKQSVWGQ